MSPVDFTDLIILAPMAGYSDFAMREVCRSMGCQIAYTEMVSARALTSVQPAKTEAILFGMERETPAVAQIFGAEPESMAQGAVRLMELGADIIDVNAGCPMPKILKSGSGAALLDELSLLKEILQTMQEAVEVPISLKLRTSTASTPDAGLRGAKLADELGLAAVAVHPRSKAQRFSGEANWEEIRRIKLEVGLPVIGNGDIKTASDIEAMFRKTGCDAVMIGRGALGNPWLFRDYQLAKQGKPIPPTPSWEERKTVMLKHLGLSIEQLGETRGILMFRKHLVRYTKHFTGARQRRVELLRATTLDDFNSKLETLID